MTTNPERDLLITPEVEACGCVTYWRAGSPIKIADLRAAWEAAGLDMALFRKAPEPATALRRAVLDLATRETINAKTERRVLVRPQQEPSTWAVVEEIVAEGVPPAYTTLEIISFVKDNGPQFYTVDGTKEQAAHILVTVMAGFQAQQGLLAPEDITTWLVKLAEAKNAVTLRDTGGVYFIPRQSLDFWNKAADAIEAASGKTHRVFRIPAMRNDEATDAIIDAVTAEAEAMAKKIDEEVTSGLGDRALETRKGRIADMLQKVGSYELLVGQQLKIRERLEALQASVAMANLVASASDEEREAVANLAASTPVES